MRAAIQCFHSPDADPLEDFRPTSAREAGALIEMMLAPAGEKGQESFQIVVGTAEYLSDLPDAHTMVVEEWDWPTIRRTLEERVTAVSGETWDEVAEQINPWAQWEFDDYRELS